MHRWLHLLGAIALILTFWTGGTARATEGNIPIGVAAESTAHFAGDSDEVPSDQHQGVPHHHSACGEHAASAWSDSLAAAVIEPIREPRVVRRRSILSGREPDTQIRPPIA